MTHSKALNGDDQQTHTCLGFYGVGLWESAFPTLKKFPLAPKLWLAGYTMYRHVHLRMALPCWCSPFWHTQKFS